MRNTGGGVPQIRGEIASGYHSSFVPSRVLAILVSTTDVVAHGKLFGLGTYWTSHPAFS